MSCPTCPIGSPCNGEKNSRLCELVDPANPAYNPAYLKSLKPPGTLEKMGNVVNAAVDFARSRGETVSDEIVARRMDVCKACDSYLPDTNQCDLCKCYLNVKTKLPGQSCPIDKWTAESFKTPSCGGCYKK